MSAREYQRVKEVLEEMMNHTITHYAIEISAATANRDASEFQSPKWWHFNLLATDYFTMFTEIVDTIYPQNERKMNDFIQRLDDECATHDYRNGVINGG